MPANGDKMLELVFSGSTALAGLILVFLGLNLTTFGSYQPTERSTVRPKFRHRGYVALIGFLSALLAAVFALMAYPSPCAALFYMALFALAVSFVMASWAAIAAVLDIG
jgi:uncharacterized membrane protein YccC